MKLILSLKFLIKNWSISKPLPLKNFKTPLKNWIYIVLEQPNTSKKTQNMSYFKEGGGGGGEEQREEKGRVSVKIYDVAPIFGSFSRLRERLRWRPSFSTFFFSRSTTCFNSFMRFFNKFRSSLSITPMFYKNHSINDGITVGLR